MNVYAVQAEELSTQIANIEEEETRLQEWLECLQRVGAIAAEWKVELPAIQPKPTEPTTLLATYFGTISTSLCPVSVGVATEWPSSILAQMSVLPGTPVRWFRIHPVCRLLQYRYIRGHILRTQTYID